MSKALANLKTLAKKVNEEHEAALGCAHAALDHAMEAGRLLAEAKAQVVHGEWYSWLTKNFNGSPRTASGYMRLAKNRAEVEANRQRVADLGVRDALAYLAEPVEAEGDDGDPAGDVDPASVPLGGEEPAEDESPEPDPDDSDDESPVAPDEVEDVPRDACGTALEPAVAEAFARKGELTGLMHRLSKVKTEVLAAAEDGDPLYTPLTPSQFKADIENAYWQLKACIPHAACPHCRQIGCDVCRGLGYVSEEVYERYQDARASDHAPDPSPPPDPEPDDDSEESSDIPDEACDFCGAQAEAGYRCRGCDTSVAVCPACDDAHEGDERRCPDCLEAKAE